MNPSTGPRRVATIILLVAFLCMALGIPGHSPAQDAVIDIDDATTTGVVDLLELSRTTTGTPAAGIGAAITFDIEDLGGVEEQARIAVELDDVTNAAEDATMTFSVNQGGTLTEVMRLDGSDGNLGIGTTTPDHMLDIEATSGDAELKLDGNGGSNDAFLHIDSNGGDRRLSFYENGTERAAIWSRESDDALVVSAYNGGVTPRFVTDVTTDGDIDGDGAFTDTAFGPSEWVLGSAGPGEVVCMTGSREDVDGETRATVVRCDHVNCTRVVGVVIPEDAGVHHGRPDLEFLDTLAPAGNWREIWRRDHVGIELAGFRRVKVLGAIAVGDTLVSAGRAGRAMASTTPGPGAIIGTAVERFDPVDGPEGSVWTRVNLQSGSARFQNLQVLELEHARLEAEVRALEDALLELMDANLMDLDSTPRRGMKR